MKSPFLLVSKSEKIQIQSFWSGSFLQICSCTMHSSQIKTCLTNQIQPFCERSPASCDRFIYELIIFERKKHYVDGLKNFVHTFQQLYYCVSIDIMQMPLIIISLSLMPHHNDLTVMMEGVTMEFI